MKGLLGKKVGMTKIFNEEGQMIPVTIVEAGPCYVLQKKSLDKDGYSAIQVGFSSKKMNRVNRPAKGHFAKAGKGMFYFVKEFRMSEEEVNAFELGQEVSVDIFTKGEFVDVSGKSKGRGFSGVIKRWNFGGGRKTHGSKFHRANGSTGMCESPAKVMKGLKMAGQYGNKRITVQNLKIVDVIKEKNLILINGAVPGPNRGVLEIKGSLKKSGVKK